MKNANKAPARFRRDANGGLIEGKAPQAILQSSGDPFLARPHRALHPQAREEDAGTIQEHLVGHRFYDYVDACVPMLARMYERRLKGYSAIGYGIDQETPQRLVSIWRKPPDRFEVSQVSVN